MSDARVDWTPWAVRELEAALDWYLERSRRAAHAFAREVDSAVTIIASAPQVWPRFEAGTRRYLPRRYPYSIVYRETAQGVEVIAVAHHKRRPLYWRDR